jgi:superfamily II DNA or RNA helicase
MRKRKEFIYNHPKKMEIAKKIIAARPNSKGITFSSTIKQAESFGFGSVVHSKQRVKENQQIIEAFNNSKSGYLHTSKSCDQGIDLKGINLEIILFTNSSKIRKTQIVGRSIRYEEGKVSEIFTLVLRGTQEVN